MRTVSGLVLVFLIVTAYNAGAFRIYKRQVDIESQFFEQPQENGSQIEQSSEEVTENDDSIQAGRAETDFSQDLVEKSQEEPVEVSPSKTPMLDLPLPYPLGYGTGPHDGEDIIPGQQELPMYPTGIMAKLPLAWPIGYGIGPHDGPLELSPEEEAEVREMLPYPIGSKHGGKNDPVFLTKEEEQAVLNILPKPVGYGDDGASLGLSSDQIHNIRRKFDEAINEAVAKQQAMKEIQELAQDRLLTEGESTDLGEESLASANPYDADKTQQLNTKINEGAEEESFNSQPTLDEILASVNLENPEAEETSDVNKSIDNSKDQIFSHIQIVDDNASQAEHTDDSNVDTPKLKLPLPYPLGYGTGPHDGEEVVADEKPLPLHPSGIMAKLPLAWPIGYGVGPHDGPLELSPAEEKELRHIIPYPIGTLNGRGKTEPLVLSPEEEQGILSVLPEPVGHGDDGSSLGLTSGQVHQIRMQFDSAIKAAQAIQKYMNRGNFAETPSVDAVSEPSNDSTF